MKFGIPSLLKITVSLMIGFSAFYAQAEKIISLDQAIALAQQNDPWLHGSKLKQQAVEYNSIASGTLPDPIMSVGMMNLPTDTWNLDQEGKLKRQQLKIESTKYPLLRENRKAKLKSEVSQLWLDAFLAQQTIKLIENDWELFEQMAEIAKASYSNVIGKTRQQDVIRAQLEIVQLEDRLTVQRQKLETSIARLNEWLHLYDDSNYEKAFDFDAQPMAFNVSETLPEIRLQTPAFLKKAHYSRNALALELENHPAIRSIDVQKKVTETAVDIAKQQYKPQWGVKIDKINKLPHQSRKQKLSEQRNCC